MERIKRGHSDSKGGLLHAMYNNSIDDSEAMQYAENGF